MTDILISIDFYPILGAECLRLASPKSCSLQVDAHPLRRYSPRSRKRKLSGNSLLGMEARLLLSSRRGRKCAPRKAISLFREEERSLNSSAGEVCYETQNDQRNSARPITNTRGISLLPAFLVRARS